MENKTKVNLKQFIPVKRSSKYLLKIAAYIIVLVLLGYLVYDKLQSQEVKPISKPTEEIEGVRIQF